MASSGPECVSSVWWADEAVGLVSLPSATLLPLLTSTSSTCSGQMPTAIHCQASAPAVPATWNVLPSPSICPWASPHLGLIATQLLQEALSDSELHHCPACPGIDGGRRGWCQDRVSAWLQGPFREHRIRRRWDWQCHTGPHTVGERVWGGGGEASRPVSSAPVGPLPSQVPITDTWYLQEDTGAYRYKEEFPGAKTITGLAPIPSALEDTWGSGGLSPRGASVEGLIHS